MFQRRQPHFYLAFLYFTPDNQILIRCSFFIHLEIATFEHRDRIGPYLELEGNTIQLGESIKIYSAKIL